MTTCLDVLLVGPCLFYITALVLGGLTPQYSPLHNTISELALGRYGYLQTANYLISGALVTALGILLVSRYPYTCPEAAIAIVGVVLLLSAVFQTDPLSADRSTLHGKIHNALFFVGMCALFAGEFATGFHDPGSPIGIFSLACGVLSLVGLVTTITRQTYHGLFQRVLVFIVILWMTGFALWVGR